MICAGVIDSPWLPPHFFREYHAMFTGAMGTLLVLGALAQPGDDKSTKLSKEELEKAHKAIMEKFPALQRGAPPLTFLDDPPLERLLPGQLFFSVIFRKHPVARLAPEPLKNQNVFIVNKDGDVEHLTGSKQLERFFRDHLRPVKSDKAAKDAVRAWLTVSQQFVQDGFYQFTIPDKEIAGDAQKITGKAVVEPKGGNKGYLAATMKFEDGKLVNVEEENKVKPGVRPICQATKLLDPDPIVRGMAEQCILVMGSAAHEYLMEQRAKASPELRQAIDRIWQRIVEDER
jgi:hypothetical protein